MSMVKWRPSRGLEAWRPLDMMEEMERRVEDVLARDFPGIWRRLPIEEKGWTPAIEMFEKDDKFVIKAELPGMKEEDIDVSITEGVLTIKGERKAEHEVKEEDYYRCERSYGSFFRSMSLPSKVDAAKIQAEYEDGILTIALPKSAEVKPKKIEVAGKGKGKVAIK